MNFLFKFFPIYVNDSRYLSRVTFRHRGAENANAEKTLLQYVTYELKDRRDDSLIEL